MYHCIPTDFDATYIKLFQLLTLMGMNSLFSIVGGARRTYLYLLQMTMINVYVSCITDPLVYLTMACRKSDLKANTTKNTGDTNKTRGRVFQVADTTTDLEAAVKQKYTVTSQVTYACEGEENNREEQKSEKEFEAEDTGMIIISKDIQDGLKTVSQDASTERASFTCTEL